MPTWLTILISILGSTGLASLIVTAIWNKQKEGINIIREQKAQEQLNQMRQVIREENQPIYDRLQQLDDLDKSTHIKLDQMQKQLKASNEGTITLLRDRMKCSLNYCRAQKFKSSTDMANWNELYETYKNLGGNHFREYVNQWKEEMEDLPTKND